MEVLRKAVEAPLLPRTVDEGTRREEIGLAQIRRAIPAAYFKPDARRSWWALMRILGCMALCLYGLSLVQPGSGAALWWQIPGLVALWVLYGWVLVGLFVIGHDCGHRSFATRKWVNTLVGYFCMSPLANSFHSWRLTHDHHHAYTQLRGQEVDWAAHLLTREEFAGLTLKEGFITRLGYLLPFGIVVWIAWNTLRRGIAIRTMLSARQWDREKRRLLLSNFLAGTCLLSIYGGLWYFCGFWGMLKYHGIPALVATLTGWLIIAIQHAGEDSILYEESDWTPVRGQLVSTFDVRFPAWLEYLWCSINFHIPHHVAAGIPWYHLKEAGRCLRQAYPKFYQEQKFGLAHPRWFYRTPFLEKEADKGYYVLDISPSRP